MKSKKSKNGFFDRIVANKYFKQFSIPVAVVLIGIVLLVVAPWQPPPPVIEDDVDYVYVTPPPETPYPEEPDVEVLDETPTPPPETPTPIPDTGIYNPLTGEPVNEDLSMMRPYAASLGNTSDALPLAGIGQADIMCEYPVEGTTRFLAIWQDVSHVGAIGGVRSLRTSNMEIAQSFDAIFAHWGGLLYEQGAPISGNPVTRVGTIDAAAIGYRFSGKPSPHNGYTSGERLLTKLPDSFRTELKDGFEHSLKFIKDGTPKDGKTASKITVTFRDGWKTTTFTYNEDDGKYYVRHHGRDLIDANDSKKLSFTNIIIIRTGTKTGYNSSGHTYIRTIRNGDGYFICGGKYVEITWSRKDETSPYCYFDLDGEPLELGVGKTFICIVDEGVEQKFE